jgi:hypothetical protein
MSTLLAFFDLSQRICTEKAPCLLPTARLLITPIFKSLVLIFLFFPPLRLRVIVFSPLRLCVSA